MRFVIEEGSATPPFEQVKAQIAAGRELGALPAGHRLPPVRVLAGELGVAAGTVARAYRELEAEGVIETRGRAGSFVTGTAETAEKAARKAAEDYVGPPRGLGLDDATAARLVDGALGMAPGTRPR